MGNMCCEPEDKKPSTVLQPTVKKERTPEPSKQ